MPERNPAEVRCDRLVCDVAMSNNRWTDLSQLSHEFNSAVLTKGGGEGVGVGLRRSWFLPLWLWESHLFLISLSVE